MARVLLKNVTKRYGDVTAVSGFDLEIKDHEFLVLVGPSGCGKSTTLRMVAGLETITSGELFIGDRLVNDVAPKDRDIAMVFQSYALYPHMTVFDNLSFSLKLRKVPKATIKKMVEATAAQLEIGDLLKRKPSELSGGQRQRVAMGRALIREPQVFLFDEPLSNLDAKLRVQMRVELSRLHQRLGTTMLYVTHDQVEAMTLADRIVVMNKGEVMQVGSPLDLYDTPDNIFVAGFIGSPSMNFVDVNLTGSGNDFYLLGSGINKFKLSSEYGQRINQAGCDNKTLTLGVRPQSLAPVTDGSQVMLESTVEVLEPMGSETFIYFTVGKNPMIARCESHLNFRAGDPVRFTASESKILLFDKDTGKRVI